MKKCYECKYRGEVPGSAHSRCDHPKVKQDDNQFAALGQMFMGKNSSAGKDLNIKADEIGIKGGWFFWPANFDPVWLENCDGFKKK